MSGRPPLALDQTSQGPTEGGGGVAKPWKSQPVIVKEKKSKRIEIIKLGTISSGISTVTVVKSEGLCTDLCQNNSLLIVSRKSREADAGLCCF